MFVHAPFRYTSNMSSIESSHFLNRINLSKASLIKRSCIVLHYSSTIHHPSNCIINKLSLSGLLILTLLIPLWLHPLSIHPSIRDLRLLFPHNQTFPLPHHHNHTAPCYINYRAVSTTISTHLSLISILTGTIVIAKLVYSRSDFYINHIQNITCIPII